MRSHPLAAAALTLILLGGCAEDPAAEAPGAPAEVEAGDSDALRSALGAARAGTTVRLSGSAYEGSFEVPAGVVVEGAEGVVVTASGGAAFRLHTAAGAGRTALRGVTLISSGGGLIAFGDGEVEIEDVVLQAATGFGLAGHGLGLATLRRVRLVGPVTDETLGELGETIDASATAILGLGFSSSNVTLEDVELTGFAGFGAIFLDTDGSWTGGRVAGCVGTGILVEGGQLELEDVVVEDGKVGRKIGFNILSNGVAVGADAILRTNRVSIRRIYGLGLFQHGGMSQHLDLEVTENVRSGIWLQEAPGTPDAPALTISGASSFAGNHGVALYLRRPGGVVVEGATISSTISRPMGVEGSDALVDVGDGIQLTGGSGALSVLRTRLEANARVGLLVDGSGAADANYRFEEVTVTGAGAAYGFLTQAGTPERGSFAGVSVDADAESRDGAAVTEGIQLAIGAPVGGGATVGFINEVRTFVGSGGLISEEGQLDGASGVNEAGFINEI